MKNWGFLFLGLSIAFFSCVKSSTNECNFQESTSVATQAEKDSLTRFVAANSLTATQHPSGVFYTIDSTGTGANPANLCSVLTVKYSGFLFGNPIPFDSFVLDQGTSFSLGGLIVGWQKVLPIIKAGSKVTLYIPPSLAYGSVDKRNSDGDIIIPRNSYLKFNIELINVQ